MCVCVCACVCAFNVYRRKHIKGFRRNWSRIRVDVVNGDDYI